MIILDDFQSSIENPSSRIYENYYLYLEANLIHEIPAVLKKIEEESQKGGYAVVITSYELSFDLNKLTSKKDRFGPLIQAWIYSEVSKVSKIQVDEYLSKAISQLDDQAKQVGLYNLRKNISEDRYLKKINSIKENIQAGVCYQINFTYQIYGNFVGHPLALYQDIRRNFPVNYGALICENNVPVLSFSPELFISRRGDQITALPMKGTASALDTTPEALSFDEKNRAENVMIVDLLRNDLGRIAKLGSVEVEDLFKVSRYGDVLQMTTKVKALLDENIDLNQIINATFPCGSITGAPKRKSIEIIDQLEHESRGIYCGSIGWFDPGVDFTFNVAIRTMTLASNSCIGNFKFGVGSGITIDSVAKDEWNECELKTRFLSRSKNMIEIFETLRVENGLAIRLKEHIDRLLFSAGTLNYRYDKSELMSIVRDTLNSVGRNSLYRLRLSLNAEGTLKVDINEMSELPLVNKVFWAEDLIGDYKPINPNSEWVKHKTTNRRIYDLVWKSAAEKGGFDGLLINQNGYIVEGGRSSIFIKPQNSEVWLTPPLSAGLLPGIMRASILNDKSQWAVEEKNITKQDVIDAKKIVLTNSLRGVISVALA